MFSKHFAAGGRLSELFKLLRAAAAAGVGLSERLRRLQIVHDLCADYAARIREELRKHELRTQPLDLWDVLKKLCHSGRVVIWWAGRRQLLNLLVPFLKPDRDVRKDVDNLKSRWNHRCRVLDGDPKP
jgi:hypothetical protein